MLDDDVLLSQAQWDEIVQIWENYQLTANLEIQSSNIRSQAIKFLKKNNKKFSDGLDARKYAFPDLMAIRVTDKEGKILSEKELKKKTPTLFGGHPKNVDKKLVIYL